MESLTATIIAKLVFDEFVKARADDAVERSVNETIELVRTLQGKISEIYWK